MILPPPNHNELIAANYICFDTTAPNVRRWFARNYPNLHVPEALYAHSFGWFEAPRGAIRYSDDVRIRRYLRRFAPRIGKVRVLPPVTRAMRPNWALNDPLVAPLCA